MRPNAGKIQPLGVDVIGPARTQRSRGAATHVISTALRWGQGSKGLARGFIRAEVMKIDDLVRLGSEREVKAHHLVRQEPKDYLVKDDDVLLIRFSCRRRIVTPPPLLLK